MAPLTWRNVEEPDFRRAGDLLNSAVQNLSGGMIGLNDTITQLRERQRRDRSAAAIPILAGVSNEAGVNPALSQIGGMVAARDMTPELQEALLGIRGAALGYDTTRNTNRINTATNARSQQTHDRNILREDQLAGMTPAVAAAMEASIYGSPNQISESYYGAVRGAESGGNTEARNPNSTATGDAQFLESTWNGLMRQYPELGLTPEGRTDSAQSDRALRRFTQDNANVLSSNGIALTNGNLYAAHFLGAGDASKVLRAGNDTLVSDIVSPAVIEANPFLEGMTVGRFRQWSDGRVGGTSPVSIAGAIPEGSLIQPSDITGLIESIYTSGDTARRDSDEDRERDRAFTRQTVADEREDLAFNRGEEDLRIQQEADDRALEILQSATSITNPIDTVMANDDLSAEEKTATISAMRSFLSENPEFTQPTTAALPDETIQNIMAEVQADIDYSNRGAGGIGGVDLLASDTAESPSVIEQFSELRSMVEESGVELSGTDNDYITVVNQVADEFGISRSAVMSLAGDYFTGKIARGGKISLDEPALREALSAYGSREDFQRARAEQTRDQRVMERLEMTSAAILDLENQKSVLQRREPSPERNARIAEIDSKLATLRADVQSTYEIHRNNMNRSDGTAPAPVAAAETPTPATPASVPGSAEVRPGQARYNEQQERQALINELVPVAPVGGGNRNRPAPTVTPQPVPVATGSSGRLAARQAAANPAPVEPATIIERAIQQSQGPAALPEIPDVPADFVQMLLRQNPNMTVEEIRAAYAGLIARGFANGTLNRDGR